MATLPPEPVSLEQAKEHLRLDPSFTDDDDQIGDLIVDAREHVEAETGLVLTPRQITETALQLGAYIDLKSWPIASVDAIRFPASGVLTVMAAGSWAMSLKRRPVRLFPVQPGWGVGAYSPFVGFAWSPPSLPVEIDVTAGFSDPSQVPARAVRAIKLLIDHWYVNRSAAEVGSRAAAVEPPFAVTSLLAKLKDRAI